MATRRLLVEIVGDDTSLQRSLKTAGATTESFGKKIVATGMSMVKAFAPIVATFAAADFAKGAIEGAENLKLAQESLTTAIDHTGGNADKLMAQYTATAKAAAQFGITQTDATRGLAKATLLTGDAASAQRAYEEALVISKATGKDFNAVLVAASKGQEGITTSLRRYGILLDGTATGQEQFNTVMDRFGGQAEANTSATERLHASFSNLQTNLGTLLLPTFEKIVNALNRFVLWLQSPAVSAAIHDFAAKIQKELQPVVDWVRDHWPQIKIVIETIGRAIIADVKNSWAVIKGVVQGALNVIRGIIDVIGGLIHGDWSRVWHGITEIVGGAVKVIWSILHGAIARLGIVAGLVGDAIGHGFTALFGWVKQQAISLVNFLMEIIRPAVDAYNLIFGRFTGNIPLPHGVGDGGNAPPVGPGGPIGGPSLRRPDAGAGNVTINVPHWVGSKADLENAVVNAMSQWARRNGNTQLRTVLGVGG